MGFYLYAVYLIIAWPFVVRATLKLIIKDTKILLKTFLKQTHAVVSINTYNKS